MMDQERKGRSISLDIVIPMYNEEKVLPLLFDRLREAFSSEQQQQHNLNRVRYLMVDDGSQDRSAVVVRNEIEKGSPAVLFRLTRNFGHQNAVSAGLEHADADVIAVIDADLQDPPEVVLEMIRRWRDGFDVVYGERTKRKENILKKISYWAFYRLLALVSEIKIPLDSGDFCVMDRRVLNAMKALPEKLRFPRLLRAWVGFRQTAHTYERSRRAADKPKYTFSKLYKLATDGVASASIRPLQISQFFSLCYLFVVISLAVVIVTRFDAFLKSDNETAIWFLICYALIAVGGLVQIFCTYILSAYVGRAYLEIKGRPTYLLMEVVGDQNRPADVYDDRYQTATPK